MHYVIGTGPAGVACAAGLIAAGKDVTFLCPGLTLEPEREARRQVMAASSPADWSSDAIEQSRTPLGPGGEVAAKLVHGSDFPYRAAPGAAPIDYDGLGLRGSHAEGGLSNVWGASLAPYRFEDIRNWPAQARDLEAAHDAVLRLMPVSAMRDDIAAFLPLPAGDFGKPRTGRQVARLLDNAARHRDDLARQGVICGRARVAARFDDGCNDCGRCLHGCPRNLIYRSGDTARAMAASGRARLISGVVVERLREDEHGVVIAGRDAKGASTEFSGERAFLAAGPVHSTAILLRSLGWHGRKVDILDSQYFVFPMLQAMASPDVVREAMPTLAQGLLEILDADLSPYAIHVQLYGYNDLLRGILAQKLGPLKKIFPENLLLGRFLLAQAYLHSDHSGRIEATLVKEGGGDRLILRPRVAPGTKPLVGRVLRKLMRLAPSLKAAPLAPLAQITEPGRGFHCGGSFPMADDPRPGQTDALGRPCGWRRAHVVDSTVFPSIAATTITQTVMANAWRIGRAAEICS